MILHIKKRCQKLNTKAKKDIFIKYLYVAKKYEIFLLEKKNIIFNLDMIFFDEKNELFDKPLIT